MDYSREKIEVFEVDDNGKIIENYLWDAYEIKEAIDSGRNIIQHGWQERLFEPRYDFEQEKWVEGLSNEEVEQRLKEIELQQNKPSEQERIEALENALLELILRSDNDD